MYDKVFNRKIGFIDIPRDAFVSVSENITEEKIYQICRLILFNKKSSDNYFSVLAQLAFYGALLSTRVLRLFFAKDFDDKTLKEVWQVGYVKDIELLDDYQNKVFVVFDELLEKAPIYSVLFFLLMSSDLILSKITKKNIDDLSDTILNLWEFTKELAYGINELVKNVIQHTTNKVGAVSGYIDENNCLRLNIIDHSEKGVLETLRLSTKNTYTMFEKDDVLKKYFEDDVVSLNSGEYKYRYLFGANDDFFLNHQTKRASAHMGLLIFSKLIADNDGRFYSYTNNDGNVDIYGDVNINKAMPIGTGFEVILPVVKSRNDKYRNIVSPYSQGKSDILSVERLLDYNEVRSDMADLFEENNDKDKLFYTIKVNKIYAEGRDFEKELYDRVFKSLSNVDILSFETSNAIVCIDFDNVSNIDSSQLFRFLGKLEIYIPKNNVILFNLNNSIYQELLKVNKYFVSLKDRLPFWNSDSVTLIYSYIRLDREKKFYFTDALWGKSESDNVYINKLIKNNNFNSFLSDNDIANDYSEKRQVNDAFFYQGVTLLPFDLLVKDSNGVSVFEYNVNTLLNIPIRNKTDNINSKDNKSISIKKQIERLQGYKVIDSHFRLGSKIHIKDFYYAKRMFQNSIYANRFSYMIAQFIIDKHLKGHYIKKKGYKLTIIGYGLYSELLLSYIVELIRDYSYKNDLDIKVNQNIYDDIDELKLLKKYEVIYDNIIIVVPIATTLSTSMKIEEMMSTESSRYNFIDHINAIIVANETLLNKKVIKEKNIEHRYGWRSVVSKEKVIKVISYYQGRLIKQRYLIALNSKWFSVKNCKICFPNDNDCECLNLKCNDCKDYQNKDKCLLAEKPLLVTDKTSVTPEMIFEYPMGNKEIANLYKYKITTQSVVCGHVSRNDNHFHYHIYDEQFFSDNKVKVNEWLSGHVSNLLASSDDSVFSDTDSVLIIAPKHFSNTMFVNKVNELVFYNSGNILHYDFQRHNIENFITFYGDIVEKAKRVYFVDDAIISGSTYKKAKEYIDQARIGGKSIDAVVFLINRSSRFVVRNIMNDLGSKDKFISFANIYLPSLKDDNTLCKLCIDEKGAISMMNASFLERFKKYYWQRVYKLKLKDLPSNDTGQKCNHKELFDNRYKNLMKVEAIHRVYEYFKEESNKKRFKEFTFYTWQNELLSKTTSPFTERYLERYYERDCFTDTSAILLKIMAITPFNKYMPVKEKIFEWTVILLNDKIEEIKDSYYDKFNYNDFRILKLLIRRVALIKSNYLITERFLMFIIKLLYNGSLEKIKDQADKGIIVGTNDDTNNEDMRTAIKENINNFITYTVSQIKELIHNNEARSIQLERRIGLINCIIEKEFINDYKVSQFIRLLQEENAVIISNFVSLLMAISKDRDIFKVFESLKKHKHYQYMTICEYYNAANEEMPTKDNVFGKYLEVLKYLHYTEKNMRDNLESKTHILFTKIINMINYGFKRNEIGLFVLIKFKEPERKNVFNNILLAYNKGKYKKEIEHSWNDNNNYAIDILRGDINESGDYNTTIDELLRDGNKWKSLYSSRDKRRSLDFMTECKDVKYMLLVRLSLIINNDDTELIEKPQGVMVFYSKGIPFNICRVRYILLLKELISGYIERHHNSAEFVDWYNENLQLRYIRAFSHNAETYEKVIDELCERVQISEEVNLIKAVFTLILNKQIIFKLYADYKETDDIKKSLKDNGISLQRYSKEEFICKYKKFIETILTFVYEKYPAINDKNFTLDILVRENVGDIQIYSKLFDEIIFEIIFNIRKHYNGYFDDLIDESDRMKIEFVISNDNLSIKNSHAKYIITEEEGRILKKRMKRSAFKKGLNIINTIAGMLYKKDCDLNVNIDVSPKDSEFEIIIPII